MKQAVPVSRSRGHSKVVSVSLPAKLLKEFDDAIKKMGYKERSKALQIAMRTLVDESRIVETGDAEATGTILVLFDHTKRNVENITQFVHTFGTLMLSALHVHLPEPNYLYVMVVRGKIADISLLEQRLRKLSGISQLKMCYLTTELGAGGESDDKLFDATASIPD
jgi:CopG family transcriptional regulator, nickel-responsive regulator